MKLKAIIIICIVSLLICLLASCQSYDYGFFEETVDTELDQTVYEECLSVGKRLYSDGEIDLSKSYFQWKGEQLTFVQNDEQEKTDAVCAYYAYITNFFETYEETAQKLDIGELENYVEDFRIHINKSVIVREDNNLLYKMCTYASIYLFEKGLQGMYCTNKYVFQREYNELKTFRSLDEEISKLNKARRIYDNSKAQDAIEYLEDVFPSVRSMID